MPTAERLRWGGAVGVLLIGALALRLWGVKHGLPYAYNADENAHFVPKAIQLFGHGWNPHYFVNPPAYTYVLHLVFAVWYGGREGVSSTFALDQGQVFIIARVVSAVLGTLAVWALYLAGARFFDRRVGLLAAALLAVAFLPVFYSHLALNDVPTLAPICLSLWGTAGILRDGRRRHYAIAGIGLGLACATKYTGGIVLLPLLAAVALRRDVKGLLLAGGLSIAAFFVANPYAFIDHGAFHQGLVHQSTAADDALGKLGLTQTSGIAYYLWTFTWGLGWVPVIAAAVAIIVLGLRDPNAMVVLAPAPVVFLLFMGTQGRFFGRWLMPIFPLVCILAAYLVVRAVDAIAARRPSLAPVLLAVGVVALCGQGLVYSLHAGLVLSRADTRNLARDWLVANVPERTRIVVEPVVPDSWAQDLGHPSALTANGYRWAKFPTSRTNVARDGSIHLGAGGIVNIEDYERELQPALIDLYERKGYCYVVSGSTQRGRAEAQPDQVPRAVAYYAELERRADKVAEFSPYRRGHGPVAFNFDWSFDFYPLAYERPGPLMTIYRLRGGACAGVS
ncbi:MAG TPA: glycosyltransferase family 39 protein [Solirubrobacteraceae bacterium]|nr:glycosyltransferase family 39 protein [Solirubrobacteraceae bacterium]